MDDPVIAAKHSIKLELKKGTYYWCSCGRSVDQPFCDGSHKVTSFTPLEFTIEEEKRYSLCRCKHTKNAPFCDNEHRNLP